MSCNACSQSQLSVAADVAKNVGPAPMHSFGRAARESNVRRAGS